MTSKADSSEGTSRSSTRTKELILAAATEVFSRNGYQGGSLREIADRVGISKAAIYYHYEDKQQILADIHNEFMDVLINRHEDGAIEGESPERVIRRVLRDILSLMVTHRSHVRVFFEHQRRLASPYREDVLRKRDAYFANVTKAVQDGIDSGEFISEVDARLVALGLFGMANWAYQWFDPSGVWEADHVARVFGNLLLDGIRI